MKIGYPCINRSINCTANRTFRLASYSEERLIDTVQKNLACLQEILEYNRQHNFLFLRISSDIIPFASHPVCAFAWDDYFGIDFRRLGRFIKKHKMRISMHPDQFVVLNSPRKDVVERSIAELVYHGKVLDAMELPLSSKMQIHVGGVYNEKDKAMDRFVSVYKTLPKAVRKRLVIEHDERSYCLEDCLEIHKKTGIPVVFDVFHHTCFNRGESVSRALRSVEETWKKRDGIPIVHYSSQQPDAVRGKHAESIDLRDFGRFIKGSMDFDFDIMLEIKDKEKSARKALTYFKKIQKV